MSAIPIKITARQARTMSYREELRRVVGSSDRLWRIMIELAEGRPYVPILPDGREGAPIVPSAEIRLRATVELADRLYGKPVSATEQLQAESQANELESIRALSDDDLARRVRALVEGEVEGELVDELPEVREVGAWEWQGEAAWPINSTPPGHES